MPVAGSRDRFTANTITRMTASQNGGTLMPNTATAVISLSASWPER